MGTKGDEQKVRQGGHSPYSSGNECSRYMDRSLKQNVKALEQVLQNTYNMILCAYDKCI